MTRLTFGQCLNLFYRYIACTGPTDPLVKTALNLVLEKFQKSPNHYKGSQTVIPLQSKDEIIALPSTYEAIDGLKTLTEEEFVILQSQQFAFNDATSNFKSDQVAIRLGGGFATQYDPKTPQIINFSVPSFLPALAPLQIRALDANGDPIITSGTEGFEIDLSADLSLPSPVPLKSIYAILKPASDVPVTITAQDDAEVIGILSPLDTNVDFQRYRIAGDDKYFAALVTKAFKMLSDQNDQVYPANLNALKYGMQAWQYEEVDDLTRASIYWQMAFKALDEELETYKSDTTQASLNIQLQAFAPRIRNLI